MQNKTKTNQKELRLSIPVLCVVAAVGLGVGQPLTDLGVCDESLAQLYLHMLLRDILSEY